MFSLPNRLPVFLLGCLLTVSCLATGCQKNDAINPNEDEKAESKPDRHPITLVVLSPEKNNFADMEKTINKEFDFLDLGEVTFRYVSPEEFLEQPTEGDLVFYSPNLFGELLDKKLIRQIPDYITKSESYSQKDVLRKQRGVFGKNENALYSISLGISSYFMLARVDVLEENGLKVPKTWSEYENVCRELSSLRKKGMLAGINKDGRFSPTLEPTKNNWLATTLIARSAAYVRTRGKYSVLFDYSSWAPLIDSPPFERALEEFGRVAQWMDSEHQGLNPREVEQAFLNGESVFAITWPHLPPSAEDGNQLSETEMKIGVFSIPGSIKKFDANRNNWLDAEPEEQQIAMIGVGGLCASVLSASKQSGVATRRLGLLSGRDFSERLAMANPEAFPHRFSHLQKIEQWISPHYSGDAAQQLINQIENQDQSQLWMVRPRVNQSLQYEFTLAREVGEHLKGRSAKESLQKVDQSWRAINKTINPEFQELISLESLGIR